MKDSAVPRVGFRYRSDTRDQVRVGYLLVIKGEYFLAATPDQVRENVYLARLPQLDPSQLKERASTDHEGPEYLYFGDVPFPH